MTEESSKYRKPKIIEFPTEAENYINENESSNMKFIWGILSPQNMTGNSPTLWTMNDAELIYFKDTSCYTFGIETMYLFKDDKSVCCYLQNILYEFTKWMTVNRYSIECALNINDVFTSGYNINTYFDTVEECYTNFRMLVSGFCHILDGKGDKLCNMN